MGSATASLGETEITAGTTLYDGQTITLKALPKSAKYLFKEWKLTKPETGVTVDFASATIAETTFEMPAVLGGQMTIQAVFVENPNYQSEECTLTDVKLLKSDGTLVKKANKETATDVTTFTVQLTPNEMTKDESLKLTSGTYKLCLTYSDKAQGQNGGRTRRRCDRNLVRWNQQSHQCGSDQNIYDYRPEFELPSGLQGGDRLR